MPRRSHSRSALKRGQQGKSSKISSKDMQEMSNKGEVPETSCPHLSLINQNAVRAKLAHPENWECADCAQPHNLYLCLVCGYLGCSRSDSAHMLKHATKVQDFTTCVTINDDGTKKRKYGKQKKTNKRKSTKTHQQQTSSNKNNPSLHSVALEMTKKCVWCFQCKCWVMNDTKNGDLEQIRNLLDRIHDDGDLPSSSPLLTSEENSGENSGENSSQISSSSPTASVESLVTKKRKKVDRNNTNLKSKSIEKAKSKKPKKKGKRLNGILLQPFVTRSQAAKQREIDQQLAALRFWQYKLLTHVFQAWLRSSSTLSSLQQNEIRKTKKGTKKPTGSEKNDEEDEGNRRRTKKRSQPSYTFVPQKTLIGRVTNQRNKKKSKKMDTQKKNDKTTDHDNFFNEGDVQMDDPELTGLRVRAPTLLGLDDDTTTKTKKVKHQEISPSTKSLLTLCVSPMQMLSSRDKEGVWREVQKREVERQSKSSGAVEDATPVPLKLRVNKTSSVGHHEPPPMLKRQMSEGAIARSLMAGRSGMRNLGNTCFVNAVMQALSNTKVFRSFFVRAYDHSGRRHNLTTGEVIRATYSTRSAEEDIDEEEEEEEDDDDDNDNPTTRKKKVRKKKELKLAELFPEALLQSKQWQANQERLLKNGGGGGGDNGKGFKPFLRRMDTEECYNHVRTKHKGIRGPLSALKKKKSRSKKKSKSEDTADFPSVNLCDEVHNVLRVIWSGRWSVITPYALIHTIWRLIPRFKGYRQQDAHEFFNCFADQLQSELLKLNIDIPAMCQALPDIADYFQFDEEEVLDDFHHVSSTNKKKKKKRPFSQSSMMSADRSHQFSSNRPLAHSPRKSLRYSHSQRSNDLIFHVFEGSQLISVNCQHPGCGYKSTHADSFLCLSLDIPPKYRGRSYCVGSKSLKRASLRSNNTLNSGSDAILSQLKYKSAKRKEREKREAEANAQRERDERSKERAKQRKRARKRDPNWTVEKEEALKKERSEKLKKAKAAKKERALKKIIKVRELRMGEIDRHPLRLATDRLFVCDVCGIEGETTQSSWHCFECDFDVCKRCGRHGKITVRETTAGELEKQRIEEEKRCNERELDEARKEKEKEIKAGGLKGGRAGRPKGGRTGRPKGGPTGGLKGGGRGGRGGSRRGNNGFGNNNVSSDEEGTQSETASGGDSIASRYRGKSRKGSRKNTTGSSCSLVDCLQHALKNEELSGDSQYFCSKCKCKRDAIKTCSFVRLPAVLVIHFQRSQWQMGRYGMKQKLMDHISFPLEGLRIPLYNENLQRTEYVTYDLAAVVNHHGKGIDTGHYTAYCRNTVNGTWNLFNDVHVRPVSARDVTASQGKYFCVIPIFYTLLKDCAIRTTV
eukprot:g3950.t1